MSRRVTPKAAQGNGALAGRRWVTWAVLLAAFAFAILGGEYSTLDWLALRRQTGEETDRVAELTRAVDSLEQAVRLLERDSREQERVARESFGMIKDGEHLYRILPAEEGVRRKE